MFNLIVKHLTEFGVNPDVLAAVLHYVRGTQKQRTLPTRYMDQSKALVVERMKRHLEGHYWSLTKSLTAQLTTDSGDWWELRGLVGYFNFSVTPTKDGFDVVCSDTWDFNRMPETLEVPITGPLKAMVLAALDKAGVYYSVTSEGFEIEEEDLVKFNADHAFVTKWTHHITWADLEMEPVEVVTWGGSYLVRKWLVEAKQYVTGRKSPHRRASRANCPGLIVTGDYPEAGYYKAVSIRFNAPPRCKLAADTDVEYEF